MARVSVNHPRVTYKIDRELPRIIINLPRAEAPDKNYLAPTRMVAVVS